jgi:acylphosphatase
VPAPPPPQSGHFSAPDRPDENGTETRRVRLEIRGRVQGVFFRRTAEREARKLGLCGFVRNTADGGVQAEAEGPDVAVGSFIRWCRRGPENARVESVAVTEIPPCGEEGFTARY